MAPHGTTRSTSLLIVLLIGALAHGAAGAEPTGKSVTTHPDSPQPSPTTFQPPGMWIWDNWFAHDGTNWHAFYLQLPKAVGESRRWKGNDLYKHVGHAISPDLRNWTDAGPALVALPGTWNDRHIATGSIIRHEKRWWMLFTGRGHGGDGVGLAVSDDLSTWTTEPKALFPLIDTFATECTAPFESTWQGRTHRWAGISDPYIYPEAVDGWFYLILCARVLDTPIETSGCLTLLRSKDLRQWEPAGIIAWPGVFERMETPQLWRRNSRWYLSFGGVLNSEWVTANAAHLPGPVQGKPSHRNYCYVLEDFTRPASDAALQYVETPARTYIMKVEAPAPGRDVALFTIKEDRGSALSLPYEVSYDADGWMKVGQPVTTPENGGR